MSGERASIEKTREPLTKRGIVEALRGLGLRRGDSVLVHSSLSALGWVVGGPVAVIDALLEVLGERGTLVMPTHTSENTEPSRWAHPPIPEAWWPVVREQMPAFDPRKTPSRGMGVIPECFRAYPGVVRSHHPIASFAARGPAAASIVAEHSLSGMFDDESPLGALYRLGARVLLLGVGHDSNTSLHLAESRATWEGKRGDVIREGSRVLGADGASRWVEFDILAWEDEDFPALGQAYEAQHPFWEGEVGQGHAKLFEQRALVDFGVGWLSTHRSR